MRTETRVLLGVTAFFVVIGVIYGVVTDEKAGQVMLTACALMGLLASGSIWLLSRHAPERAEDRDDATVADGAGVLDAFPTRSVWPFAVGLSATVMASGLAIGSWLVLIGAGAFLIAIVCFVAESRNAVLPSERSSGAQPSTDTSSGSSIST